MTRIEGKLTALENLLKTLRQVCGTDTCLAGS